MKHKMILLACAAVASTMSAIPASATPILFELTGGKTASFTIDSDAIPASTSSTVIGGFNFGDQISYNNIAGTFGGTASNATIGFGTDLFATLNIGGTPLGFTQYAGPNLFSLVDNKPVFNFGTFNLSSLTSGPATIKISSVTAAVPEPATWALMMFGFAAVGFTMRRQKVTARVRYLA